MINVKTGEFLGPFDLLLDLIEKSKIDIYNIQISEITKEYVDTISTLNIPADEIADFVLIATQLLYIKTNSLVKDTFIEDEKPDEEEVAITKEELIKRLIEYKKIKGILKYFKEFEINGRKKFYKLQEDLSIYGKINEPLSYDLNILTMAINNIVNKNLNETEFKVDRILNIDEYSLETYNNNIKMEIINKKIISITNMLKKIDSKSEAIIIFLSILELSKRKDLTILQDKNTLEIFIQNTEI